MLIIPVLDDGLMTGLSSVELLHRVGHLVCLFIAHLTLYSSRFLHSGSTPNLSLILDQFL